MTSKATMWATYEDRLQIARAQMSLKVKGPPAIVDDGSLFTQAFLRRGVPLIEKVGMKTGKRARSKGRKRISGQ